MKKFNILITIASIGSLCACNSNFLDSEDLVNKNVQNYYAKPAEVAEALVGCYDGLQLIGSTTNLCIAEVLSDNSFGGAGASDGGSYQALDRFDLVDYSPASGDIYNYAWANYYKAINRCNTLLEKMGGVNWKGVEGLRSQYAAEARFIRAYCYFDLVRFFGPVPLITNIDDARKNLARTPVDDIYKVIATDLKYAADSASASTYIKDVTNNGRINKWAAKALLARVYLYYTGHYGKSDLVGLYTKAQALGGLEEIIAKNEYGLIDSFSNLWPASAKYRPEIMNISFAKAENTYAGEGNKETVFGVKYTYTGDYATNGGNGAAMMNGIRGVPSSKNTNGYSYGWGANTVDPRVLNLFTSADKRKKASIIDCSAEGVDLSKQSDQLDFTGYYIKKYTPLADSTGKSLAEKLGGTESQFSQFQDHVVIRYADVLLMAVELGSINASSYWSQVLTRAGLDPSKYEYTDKAILFEQRRLEFLGEGIRYWDMLRYDSDLTYAAAAIERTLSVKNSNVDGTLTITGTNLKTHYLQQIPHTQITLSAGVLEQNKGW